MPKNVKITTFPGLLDLVSPHSCRGCGRLGEVFCDRCKNYIITRRQNFCPNCKTENPSGDCEKCQDLPPIFVVSDRNDILGELIHDYKYHSIRALAKPLAELLNAALPENLPQNSIFVPLPTATHHIRERGLDHTYLISKHLSRIRGIPTERLLKREKNTVQVGSDRSDRLAQASSAYGINEKTKIDPTKTYILIDDVWTTGASITAAAEKLRAAGAEHIIFALLAYSAN